MKPVITAAALFGILSLGAVRAQDLSAKDIGDQLGIPVKEWTPEGHLVASWPFTEARQSKGFALEGVKPKVDPERGLVFKPALAEAAVASLHEIQLRAPCKITIEVLFESTDASFFLMFADGRKQGMRTTCFVNHDYDGKNVRGAGAWRDLFLRKMLGDPSDLGIEAGRVYTFSFELKEKSFRMTTEEQEQPLAIDDAWPHESFRLAMMVEGGEVALRSIQLDSMCLPETARKMANAAGASGRADAIEKSRAQSEAGWHTSQVEMDGERSTALADCMRGEDANALKAGNQALELCKASETEKAVTLIEALGDASEKLPRIAWLLGRARRGEGDIEQALEPLELAARAAPKVPEFWRELAGTLSEHGDDAGAMAAFARYEALEPQSPWVHLLRAQHHLSQSRPDEAEKEIEAGLAKGKSKGAKSLAAELRRLKSRPDWRRAFKAEKGAYVVETDVSEQACAEMAAKLDVYRGFLEQSLPLPKKQKAPCRVWVFDSEEGYKVFTDQISRRAENTLGVYQPRIKTLLFFHTLSSSETDRVLLHEAFHQYLDTAVPHAPTWFNEGMAEYYGATTFDAEGKPVEGGIQKGRLGNLTYYIYSAGVVPFPSIMTMSHSAFLGNDAARNYAQAWAMIHWFKRGPNPEARNAFARYTEQVVAGRTIKQAYQEAFGALSPSDVEQWHEAFRDYVFRAIRK